MYRYIKRAMDIVISLLALIVLSPVLLILMLLIRLDSPGSPVFAQKRVGRDGKSFTIYKLRTMKKTAPQSVATSELADATSHITRLGAFLRVASLDELPQFVNILRGDMSLVGPRPLVPEETSVHEERMRLGVYKVCPGVTGWAQVNGRDTVNAGKKAELDAYYAENVSFRLDMHIIMRTISYVLTARGIQEGTQPEEAGEEDMLACVELEEKEDVNA